MVAIESLLIMDLAMDLIAVAVTQLALGGFRLRRALAALGALSLYTLAARLLYAPLAGIAGQCAAALAAAALCVGSLKPLRILEAFAVLNVSGAVCAGFALLARAQRSPVWLIVPAGAAATLALLRLRRHIRHRWDIELYVEQDGLSVRLTALVDTGNRLLERASALPVVIAEADAVAALSSALEALPQARWRTLDYGVLGANGRLRCFRPDKMRYRFRGEDFRPAPDCWLAVYPGRLPGFVRALAPPEFAAGALK